mgnify:FL=1|jgi:ribosome-associated protein YbcJ (S4-like RNA binding protein)
MTLKEELFEMYEMDNSTHALYNTLKLIGVTEKGKDAKRFLREYQVWKQIKDSKVKELRDWEKNNNTKSI